MGKKDGWRGDRKFANANCHICLLLIDTSRWLYFSDTARVVVGQSVKNEGFGRPLLLCCYVFSSSSFFAYPYREEEENGMN